MTKQQAIKAIVKRGWVFVRNYGKFSVVMCSPSGQEGVYDPRDLLAELQGQDEALANLIFGNEAQRTA